MTQHTILEFKGFKADIAVSPLKGLFPHEETLHDEVTTLSDAIVRDSMQRDPIIVDRATGVILDGMHRYKSLETIGARLCVVCFVDYNDTRIRVGRWLRMLEGNSAACRSIAEEIGATQHLETRIAMKVVDKGKASAVLVSGNEAFGLALDSQSEGADSFPKGLVRRFDRVLNAKGIEVSIVADNRVEELIESKRCFLYPRAPRKEQIVESAKSGDLFPAKSTRHEIPVRPVGVNFPLQNLLQGDEAKANSELERMLEKRKVTLLKPGSSYQGRVYNETLFTYE
ncbi:MAG: hypothetical protein QXV32_08240 [Conexivisphaerales archaeon]